MASSLNVVITADNKAFKRAVDDTDKSLKNFGTSAEKSSKKASKAFGGISGAAKLGLGAVVTGAGAAAGAMTVFAKDAVDAASDVEESLSKNRTLFGKYADDVEDFAKRSSGALGISRRAALDYTGVFGNLTRGMKFSKEESAKMSTDLVKLAADLASFNNTSVEDALNALRSGLVGESEPLRAYGVTLSETSIKAEAVRSGIVKLAQDQTKAKGAALQLEEAQRKAKDELAKHGEKSIEYRKAANDVAAAQDKFKNAAKGTVPELTAQEKALAIVKQVMEQTAPAQGDAAKTADNYAGQVKRLGARLEDLKVTLGERLLPVFEDAVTWTNDLFEAFGGGEKKKEKFVLGLEQAKKASGEYAGAAEKGSGKTQKFKDAVEDVGGVIGDYKDGVEKVAEALEPYLDLTKDVVDWTKRHEEALVILDGAIRDPIENLNAVATALEAIAKATEAIVGAFGDSKFIAPILKLAGTGDGLGKTAERMRNVPNFGGGLMGARPAMAPIAGFAARLGARVSSGLRPGARTTSGNASYHSTGEALDLAGSPAAMLATFRGLKSAMGGSLAELIYTPGGTGIRNGAPHKYTGQVAADHRDHVHVALDTGAPGVGDGYGQIRNLWTRAGGSPAAADMAAAIAMAESSGSPNASHRNADGSIDRGLWQINSVHGGLSTFDRMGNARAAIQISGNGRNWNPWTVFKTGAYKRFLQSGGGSKRPRSGSSLPDPLREARVAARTSRTIAAAQNASNATRAAAAAAANPFRKGISQEEADFRHDLAVAAEQAARPEREAPTGFDWLDLALAQAEATPGTADDIAAMKNIRSAKQAALAGATDPRDQAALIREITSLTAAIEASNDLQRQRDAQQAEILANQAKILALAKQGPQIVAAVVAAVSGGIGGQVGLGVQTPGYAGGVARY